MIWFQFYLLFDQMKKTRILYHDYPKSIILKKAKIIINSVQKKKNIFVLDPLNIVNRIIIF